VKEKSRNQNQIAGCNKKGRHAKEGGVPSEPDEKKRNKGPHNQAMKNGKQRKLEERCRKGGAGQGEKNAGKKEISQSKKTEKKPIPVCCGNCQRERNLLE
jgi:hypothetical protein